MTLFKKSELNNRLKKYQYELTPKFERKNIILREPNFESTYEGQRLQRLNRNNP